MESPAPVATAASAHAAPRLGYEPALDGLRAIAVLAVIGYHARVSGLRGGFLGVDVFFVLSGYLITALLLAERADTGGIGIRAFYGRRARRLLPALLLVLLGISAYGAFVAYPGDRGAIRADALCSLFYVQNWHLIWTKRSYFTDFAAPSPARHLWSLSIEEQFYIVWPFLLGLLLGFAKRRRWIVYAVIIGLAVASVALMALLYKNDTDPSRAYYGTDTRAHELLVGALLALILSRPRPWIAKVRPALPAVALLSAAVLLFAFVRIGDTSAWMYRGGFLVIAVVTALLVGSVVNTDRGWLRRGLTWPPLVWVGLISYGLYLWHWPVLLWLNPDRTGLHGVLLLAIRLAVTFAIAIASYRFVERPIRSGLSFAGWRRRIVVVSVFAIVVVAVAVTIPAPTPPRVVLAPASAAPLPPLPGPTTPSTTPYARALLQLTYGPDARFWAPGDLTIQSDFHPLADGVIFLPTLDRQDGRPHIVMVGDSVLLTLARSFDPGPSSRADYYSYPEPGCALLPGVDIDHGRVGTNNPACTLELRRWKMLVDRRRPDVSFMLIGGFDVLDRLIDGHRYRVGTPEWSKRVHAVLLRDVDLFSSRGGLVALPTVPCFNPPDYGVAGAVGGATDRRDPSRAAAVNAVVRQVARERPKVVRIIDLASFLCPGGKVRAHINGVALRDDGVHFTRPGAHIVARWLAPRLETLVPPGPVFATKPTAPAPAP